MFLAYKKVTNSFDQTNNKELIKKLKTFCPTLFSKAYITIEFGDTFNTFRLKEKKEILSYFWVQVYIKVYINVCIFGLKDGHKVLQNDANLNSALPHPENETSELGSM